MAINRATAYPGRFDNATSTRPQGAFKNRTTDTSKDGSYLEKDWLNDWDGLLASMLIDAGESPNGVVDEGGASQLFDAMKKGANREPLNNSWNGFFRRDQETLPSPAGFPSTSGGGGTVYSAGDEFTFGWKAVNAATNISIDDDGMIFSDNVAVEIQMGTETTLTASDIVVYCKDNLDNEYWFKNGNTGVAVGIAAGLVTVTLSPLLFGELAGTKLKWCFALDEFGRVGELSGDDTSFALFGHIEVNAGQFFYRIYKDGTIYQSGTQVVSTNTGGGGVVIYPITVNEITSGPICCPGDNNVPITYTVVIGPQVSSTGFGFVTDAISTFVRVNYEVWGKL